jgi:ABC-type multidrug transport system ATPase subunit
VIELNNVAKTFGGSVPALRDVSFSVPTGSVCALLGHNGAGKTTTVNILSTLLKPSSGTALVAGYDVVRESAQVRRSIGVTGQDAALDLRLTGRENLVLFGRLRGLRRAEVRARVMRPTVRSAATPAGCGGASTSPCRSSSCPRCCSWTNRRPDSIRAAAATCGTWCRR